VFVSYLIWRRRLNTLINKASDFSVSQGHAVFASPSVESDLRANVC
jgi:hypothetical protein